METLTFIGSVLIIYVECYVEYDDTQALASRME